jgi:hypothetical protein
MKIEKNASSSRITADTKNALINHATHFSKPKRIWYKFSAHLYLVNKNLMKSITHLPSKSPYSFSSDYSFPFIVFFFFKENSTYRDFNKKDMPFPRVICLT